MQCRASQCCPVASPPFQACCSHHPGCRLFAGVLLSKQELQEAADTCAAAGAWLVVDNTYEDFVYDLGQHHCISAPHIIHIFSMSKASVNTLQSNLWHQQHCMICYCLWELSQL